jgi:hypothetical protein
MVTAPEQRLCGTGLLAGRRAGGALRGLTGQEAGPTFAYAVRSAT